jgi:hypothetical protein
MIEQSKVQACPLLCEKVPVTGVSRFQSKTLWLICPFDWLFVEKWSLERPQIYLRFTSALAILHIIAS